MTRRFTLTTRRRFLGALGAGSVLVGLDLGRAEGAPEESPPKAKEAAKEPLRFIGVYTPHGRAYEYFKPGPGFDLRYENCSLRPFDDPDRFGKSYKDKLLVIDGIDLAAGIEVGTTGHDAPRVILTGSGADGTNASVDQFLAQEKMLGADTPHTSLVLGVGNDQSDIKSNISYAPGGTPVPKWIDPAETFDELFGKPLSLSEKAELSATRARQKSVLDFLREDLSQLSARAPASERIKLEQHVSALREIEKRLSPRQAQKSCARPERHSLPKLRAYGGGEPYFDEITNLQIDLLARAIACDLTRFSTLFLNDLTRAKPANDLRFADLPVDIHNDVAHRYSPRTETSPGNPDTWLPLAKQNLYSYEKVVRLLTKLDESKTLADCLVYVSSDMGNPSAHSSRNVPTLLCGGCGGNFRMGRYIDARYIDAAAKADKGELCSNNRILVSICNAFGVNVSRFGHSADPKTTTGALDALTFG